MKLSTEFAIFMGRGGGKNGLISAISDFLSTPLHGVKEYHISIVANSEDQAKHRLMKSEPF